MPPIYQRGIWEQGSVPAASTALLYDDFARTAADLGSAPVGGAWTQGNSQTWETDGTVGFKTSGSGAFGWAWIDVPTLPSKYEIIIDTPNQGNYNGVWFRGIDETALIFSWYRNSDDAQIQQLKYYSSGSWGLPLASNTWDTAGCGVYTAHTYARLRVNGNALSWQRSLNGTTWLESGKVDHTETQNAGGTRIGLFSLYAVDDTRGKFSAITVQPW